MILFLLETIDALLLRLTIIFRYSGTLFFHLYFPGEFHGYWNEVFRVTKLYREDYGTLPNKSTFDKDWYEKRNKAALDEDNKFDPHPQRNVEHFVWCALENVMCQFCLRGNLEPSSLLVEDFTQEYIQEGAFKGIPCFVLRANYSGQKGHALSLRNPTHDVENTKKKTYPCPYNKDELSCYQTLLKLFEMMPDADVCEDGRNGGRF